MSKLHLCRCALAAGGPVRLLVAGTSMLPLLWPGDRVKVCPISIADLRPGDVVAYSRNGRVIVHRIIRQTSAANAPAWITQGDNEQQEDPLLLPAELLGVVATFQRFGAERRIDCGASFPARLLSDAIGRSRIARFVLMWIYARLVGRISGMRDSRAPS